MWPTDADALRTRQHELAALTPTAWTPPGSGLRTGGCWVCFPRAYAGPGGAGDPAWGAAVVVSDTEPADRHVRTAAAGSPYLPGLLALRIGALVEQLVRSLARAPDVLLVDATSRDHPRRAGLALHLGAELGVPTVGVTDRPLLAEGPWPGTDRGATSPLRIGDEVVGCWLRTSPGCRPLVVHPGWRVSLHDAVGVVARSTCRYRTPEPLRLARQAAREARSGDVCGTVGRNAG
jgi:deoxyribonuclease V